MRANTRKSLGNRVWVERSGAHSVMYRHPLTGKEIGPVVAKGARNKTEAMRWRADLLREIEEKRRFSKDESVSDLGDYFLSVRADAVEDGTLKDSTYEVDAHAVATIRKWFGTTRLSEVDVPAVRAFNRALKSGKGSLSGKPLAPKSRQNVLQALSQMFDLKIADNNGGYNPVSGLQVSERSQKRQREPIEMSQKDIDRVIYLARKHAPGYWRLFLLLSVTGMRIEEALNIRWEDVDLDAGYIAVTNGKQKASAERVVVRLVPIPEKLQEVVGRSARMGAKWSTDEDFVFAAGPGAQKSYRNVRRALRSVSEKAGYGPTAEEHIRSHDFRHSLCVIVRPHLRNYADKLSFCRSLGWVDTTMFDKVYGQSRDERESMAEVAADVLLRAGVGV